MITCMTDVQIWGIDRTVNCADDISVHDLRAEAKKLDAENTAWKYWRARAYNTPAIEILYIPSKGRAGVFSGGNSDWTDCTSAQDALERFFDNKMVN